MSSAPPKAASGATATATATAEPSSSAITDKPTMTSASASASNADSNPHPNSTKGVSNVLSEKEKKRIALRSTNLSINSDASYSTSIKGPFDSNLKKNTAFVKRVKQNLGVESKDQFLKEITTLGLDKYREEIVGALPEGMSRLANGKDIAACMEILTSLHQRFGEGFHSPLTSLFTALLSMPSRATLAALPTEQREREEQSRVTRQKVLFRVSAEAALLEIIGEKVKQEKKVVDSAVEKETRETFTPGCEWLFNRLKDLLNSDREHTNVPIVLHLLKALGPVLMGPSSSTTSSESSLLSSSVQARFRKVFEGYWNTLSRRLEKEHQRLIDQDKRNHEAYIKSGEIFEDRQQSYEKLTKNFEKLVDFGKTYSELLGLSMPDLTTSSKGASIGLNLNNNSSALDRERAEMELAIATGKSPWEDEDSRRFYEELPDLKDLVPMSILKRGQTPASLKAAMGVLGEGWGKISDQKKEEGETATEEKSALEDQQEASSTPKAENKDLDITPTASPDLKARAALPSSPQLNPSTISTEPSPNGVPGEEGLGAGPAAQLAVLLARLPEQTNRTMIDSAAIEFAFLNSRAARNRLVTHFVNIPRNRSDLIPYYARMIAILAPFMPDLAAGVVSALDDEFRYLQRKRNADLAETRAKNCRFISELVKFRVFPLHMIFHSLKVCLDDFSGANIDNLATFLETCGRFLLRTSVTSERTRSLLEMLRRKRAAHNLDHRQVLVLDNAYYQCNPPERKAQEIKVRSPMEQYIRHLIYDVLSKRNCEKVVKLLRKLDWNDEEVKRVLHAALTRVWRIRFSNIYLLAIVVYELQTYHPEFTIGVIDDVCENMRAGMESNIFKHNQRRVATIKYFGELYNYRLVNTNMIFDQLWSLVTFGHAQGRPLPASVQVSPLDAPDDYFRIRLACTLLDTCGMCFDRGAQKTRLDDYLIFLNLYVNCKEQPIPMDVDFMLEDTLEQLRPGLKFKKTFEESAVEVDAMLARNRTAPAQVAANQEEEDEDEDDDEEAGPRGSRAEEAAASDSDEEVEGKSAEKDALAKGEDAELLEDEDGVDGVDEMDDDEEDEEEEEDEEDEEALARERQRAEEEALRKEEDDEFERELAKMMAESTSTGGTGVTSAHPSSRQNKNMLEEGLPFIRKARAERDDAMGPSSGEEDGEHMKFSLLSKKGNRHLTHDVKVPLNSAIAISTRSGQLRDQAERRQLKDLVLSYDFEGRENAEDREDLERTLASQGFKLKFKNSHH